MDEKEQNNSKFKAIPVTGSSSYEKAKKSTLRIWKKCNATIC